MNIYKCIILLLTAICISVLQGCSPARYSILPGPAEQADKDVTLIITGHNRPDGVPGIERIDREQFTDKGNKNRAEYKLTPGRHTVFYYLVRPGDASIISSADLNISFAAKAGHSYELSNYTRWNDASHEKASILDFLTMVIDTTEGDVVAWESRAKGDFKEEIEKKTALRLTQGTEKNTLKTGSSIPPAVSTDGNALFLDFVNKGNEYGLHKAVFLDYVYKGNKYGIYFTVSRVVHEKLMSTSRSLAHGSEKQNNTKKDFILKRINNPLQREKLLPLVEKIRSLTPDVQARARIAISLVQNIPYSDVADYEKYPYGVLWEHGGACSEKADLLLFLLRELGFGTATLVYKNENHRAVGIKCPDEYDVGGSGYCYVETTTPRIITDNKSGVAGVGTLTDFTTVHISDGIRLEGVEEEFADKKLYHELVSRAEAQNWCLDQNDYDLYSSILNKYGME